MREGKQSKRKEQARGKGVQKRERKREGKEEERKVGERSKTRRWH